MSLLNAFKNIKELITMHRQISRDLSATKHEQLMSLLHHDTTRIILEMVFPVNGSFGLMMTVRRPPELSEEVNYSVVR